MLNPQALMALQRGVGNAAVVHAVTGQQTAAAPMVVVEPSTPADAAVQRFLIPGDVTTPPVAPAAPDPGKDPKFAAVKGAVKKSGRDLKKHPTPASEVSKAQGAAKAPSDDKASQAKAARLGTMAAAKPKGFDKAAFIAAVKQAIAKAAPKNLDEADKFGSSGKADGVKGEVMSKVTSGKDASASDVKGSSEEPPDTSVAKEKPVTPLVEPKPVAPPPVNAAAGMPSSAPTEQVNFAAGPDEVNQKMKDADVSEEALTKSNEPDLQGAVTAKKEAEAHSAAAPAKIRQSETQALHQAQGQAQSGTKTAMGAMLTGKTGALGRVAASKNEAKSKDEAERARVAGDINKIFDKTKTDVDAILNGLDAKVTAEFDKGEAAARAEFTKKHQTDMEAYKDERYSGVIGAGRWVKDKFAGLPSEANRIYDNAKALYESRMTTVISAVADLIGRELDAAKARIALGKQQIDDYIKTQPKNLQKVADAAGKEVSAKFEQLESDVDAKQESLVDDLANKYVESRNKVDDEIKAEQEKNKGLIDKVKDAVGGAIQVILKLKDLFLNLLSRAASAFSAILKDPIGFISNFMSAVKQGFLNFVGNIWEHLKKGLLGWLFGALAEAGIELPEKFDIKGLLKLVASIMGLTWGNLKNRIMKMAPWVAKVIDVVESKIEVFKILATEGVAGLWNWIKEKLGDLKEMILTPIKDFVIEKIVKAGITWVLGMLNPAGALIKIVQALIGVVQWIMERGAALTDFIGTVIDAVVDIAKGGVGGVPAKIEASLGKAVPLVISFLANLLGLGGISDKIKSILQTVQKPINKVIDTLVKGALNLARPLIKGVKNIGAKVKAKVLGGDDSPEGKQKRLEKGVRGGVAVANKLVGRSVGERVLRPLLGAVRMRYGLAVLEPVKQGKFWAVHGEVQRMVEQSKLEVLDTQDIEEAYTLQKIVSPVQDSTRRALSSAARKASRAGGAQLTSIKALQAKYAPLETEFLDHKAALASMRKSNKGDPAKLTAMRSRFPVLLTDFQAIQDSSKLATADPSEIEAQAKLLRGEIDGKATKAREVMAKPDVVTYVLSNPVQAEVAGRLQSRLKAITDGLAALPSPVNTIPDMDRLQTIMEIANGLQNDATRADKIRALNVQVKEEATKIDGIIDQTTTGGRPGASRPDPLGEFEKGSAEAAARAEVFTKEKTGDRWHGDKCADDARGLRAAIANLRTLRGLPGAAQVEFEIKAALERAEKRLPGLEAGAKVWAGRFESHPKLWARSKGSDESAGST